MQIIPLQSELSTSEFSSSSYGVNWKFRDHQGLCHEMSDRLRTIEATSFSHITSFVSCEHPKGKWWESLFIPFDAFGGTGLMITTWGRDAGVNGFMQDKVTSEIDWYSVASSKFGKGGYGVHTYLGREGGLTSGQANCVTAMKAHTKQPPMGLTKSFAETTKSSDIENGITHVLAAAAWSNIKPVHEFIEKAKANGHNVLGEINNLISNQSEKVKRALVGVINGFDQAMTDGNAPSVAIIEPEPQVDRDEAYGSQWGFFG